MFRLIKKLRQSRAHSTGNWTVCTLRFRGCPIAAVGFRKREISFPNTATSEVVHEIGSTNDPNVRIDEVKAVVTLRSGKELRPVVPALAKTARTVADPPEEEQSTKREEVKTSVPPPFPQALRKKKIPLTKLKC